MTHREGRQLNEIITWLKRVGLAFTTGLVVVCTAVSEVTVGKVEMAFPFRPADK